MRGEPGDFTDSDLWEQGTQGEMHGPPRAPAGSPAPARALPTCTAVWYRSSFSPSLTVLAGSRTLALRGRGQDEAHAVRPRAQEARPPPVTE